ncbi:MAG: diguanylate cyclase [Spirochaetes bacterium]|nr:diguanylate cyclase [Spirochaetota bacterium]
MKTVKESLSKKEIEKYERKIFDLRQLIEISKGLNSTLEYNILIESILLTCMGQMQCIKAGIFLKKDIDDESFILHRNYKGFELNHNHDYIINHSSRLIELIAKSPNCLTFDEISRILPEDTKALITLSEINPILVVPLKGKGKLNGIIVLGERINELPFNSDEKEYLLDIGALAGIAIENAYLYELATTDMMTKLKIHHFFQTTLMEERENALRRETPLSLIFLDIDNFKLFNDKFGHICGDIVLKRVANIIKLNCRQNDIAARYGGEEMAIILPKSQLKAALVVAERIRSHIAGDVVLYDGKELSVTVSVGVSQFIPEVDKTNDDFVSRTDKALYMAKEQGKNKVCHL